MESLYRKYRPQTFADVVGQQHVVTTLERAVTEGRITHAYLFCGPRGTGKTTMARLLAKALLCDAGPSALPDGTCEQCQLVAAGEHPDVYELDAASRTGVDNVREEIIGSVSFAPVRGRYKVYIIDEVHMLTTAAFNALLKTLEEPPEHVIFVLCTTEAQKVPETILSRVQRFDFRAIAMGDLVARLAYVCEREGVAAEDAALTLVARHARGGMRDALGTLEQLAVFGGGAVTLADAEAMLGTASDGMLSGLVTALAARDVATLFAQVASLADAGGDLLQFARELTARLRDVYVVAAVGGGASLATSTDDAAEIATEASAFGNADRVARALDVLADAMLAMRTAPNQRLALEIAFTRIARPEADLTLEALAERVAELEGRVARLAGVAATSAVAPAASASQPVPTVAAPLTVPDAPRPSDAAASAPHAPEAAPSAPEATGAPNVGAATPPSAPTEPAPPAPFPAPDPAPAALDGGGAWGGVETPRVADEARAAAAAAVAATNASATAVAVATPSANGREDATPPVAPGGSASPDAGTPQTPTAVSEGDLQRRWGQVVDALVAEAPARGSLLASATLECDDGQTLHVTLPKGSTFATKMLLRQDVQATIAPVVERFFGRRRIVYAESSLVGADIARNRRSGGATADGTAAAGGTSPAPTDVATPAPATPQATRAADVPTSPTFADVTIAAPQTPPASTPVVALDNQPTTATATPTSATPDDSTRPQPAAGDASPASPPYPMPWDEPAREEIPSYDDVDLAAYADVDASAYEFDSPYDPDEPAPAAPVAQATPAVPPAKASANPAPPAVAEETTPQKPASATDADDATAEESPTTTPDPPTTNLTDEQQKVLDMLTDVFGEGVTMAPPAS